MASSSTSSPRAVLMSTQVFFIREMTSREMILQVSSVRLRCREIKSESAINSSNVTLHTPFFCILSADTYGSYAITRQLKPYFMISAKAEPMFPYPMIPMVLPLTRIPRNLSLFTLHSSFRAAVSAFVRCLLTASNKVTACSATSYFSRSEGTLAQRMP